MPTYSGSIERNLERVTEIGTRVPLNTQQKYSNLGFQLLGKIVARVSGVPYAEYVRERILQPLGMTGTASSPCRTTCFTVGRPATRPGSSDELERASTPPPVWAEGGLWSCIEDMARWISFQLRKDGGAREGAQILAGSTLREMHLPRYLGNEEWTEAWCIAWYAQRKEGVT